MPSSQSTVNDFMFATVTNIANREAMLLSRLADPEDASAVHEFRVEIRKLRSILGSCSPLIKPNWLKRFRSQLKEIDTQISPLRDAHVLFNRFNGYPDTITSNNYALYVALESKRNQAQIAFQAHVHSIEFNTFLTNIDFANPKEIHTKKSEEFVYVYLEKFNRDQWKSLKTKVRTSKTPELHKVRIKAKKVRYLAEASIPVLGQKIEKRAHIANQIQTLLGELQDSKMMIELASTSDILELEEREIERIEKSWERLKRKVLK